MFSARTHQTRIVRFLALLGVTSMLAAVTHASQVMPINLEEMTHHAGSIFAGRVIESRTTLDPTLGRKLTVTVFEVDQAVKGQLGSTVSVRTLGGRGSEAIAGMPVFNVGDEVVLFLYGESKLGLTSPVGLGQGYFSIVSDKQGQTIAINEFGNDRLLTNLTQEAQTRLGPALSQPGAAVALKPSVLLGMAAALLAGETE